MSAMHTKNPAAQTFFFLGSLVLIGYLLSVGKSFLQPFVIAVILWYLIVSLTHTFQLQWKSGWRLPEPLALSAAIVVCVLSVWLVSSIVTDNVEQINQKLPHYQANFIALSESVVQSYAPNSDFNAAQFLREKVFATINLNGLISGTALTLGGAAGKLVLICIYVLFLLLEHKMFPQKLERMTTKGPSYARTVSILQDVSKDLSSYFKIKTVANEQVFTFFEKEVLLNIERQREIIATPRSSVSVK